MPVSGDEIGLPLSAAQLGIWFAHKLNPNTSNYNLGGWTEIYGAVDPRLLETAIRQAATDTEALRVRFIENWLQIAVPPTLAWDYPTIEAAAGYLADQIPAAKSEGAGPETTN